MVRLQIKLPKLLASPMIRLSLFQTFSEKFFNNIPTCKSQSRVQADSTFLKDLATPTPLSVLVSLLFSRSSFSYPLCFSRGLTFSTRISLPFRVAPSLFSTAFHAPFSRHRPLGQHRALLNTFPSRSTNRASLHTLSSTLYVPPFAPFFSILRPVQPQCCRFSGNTTPDSGSIFLLILFRTPPFF